MKKEKKVHDRDVDENPSVNEVPGEKADIETADVLAEQNASERDNELKELNKKLEEKSIKCDEYLNMLQRNAAEFDNFKKRTVREKEELQSYISGDVIGKFLPVVDNIERALLALEAEEGKKSLKEGVELVFKQLKDTFKNLGVEEIKGVGEQFDPQLHNAVMHIEDEAYPVNTIVEEFQKGYMLKERVIRHSVVKVAN